MSDIWKRKKFGEVLEVFGLDGPGSCTPIVFPLPLEGHRWKVRNWSPQNSAKSLETTQKNEFNWTLFIWLSLADFGDEVTICGIYETFLGIAFVLPRSTIANSKQCKSSTSVSNNWRHVALSPQGCLPVVSHVPFKRRRSKVICSLGKCVVLSVPHANWAWHAFFFVIL